jgi:(2R)-3-sulfolactate dehydrogenase (NADP+)
LVIDLSLSKVARGKVMAADKAGDSIPEGWALDRNGQATTDPKAALAGSMVPLGDAKGAALSLMVEILSASLIGANHSFEATSFFDAEGAPPGVGQMIIAIDPKKFGGQAFETRLSALCSAILEQSGTRLPGASRGQKRQDARQNGVNIPSHLRKEVEDLIADA